MFLTVRILLADRTFNSQACNWTLRTISDIFNEKYFDCIVFFSLQSSQFNHDFFQTHGFDPWSWMESRIIIQESSIKPCITSMKNRMIHGMTMYGSWMNQLWWSMRFERGRIMWNLKFWRSWQLLSLLWYLGNVPSAVGSMESLVNCLWHEWLGWKAKPKVLGAFEKRKHWITPKVRMHQFLVQKPIKTLRHKPRYTWIASLSYSKTRIGDWLKALRRWGKRCDYGKLNWRKTAMQ